MQIIYNNQAYVGLFLALLVIIFLWWMISLKVKKEVRKYGEENIRNPTERRTDTNADITKPAIAVQGIDEQRGGISDDTVKEFDKYLGDTVEPSRSDDREQQTSESSGETDPRISGADSVPEPAEFEEI